MRMKRVNIFFKRFLDIFLSSLGLILSWPLWVLIALIIYLEDDAPIFYVQPRPGKYGKIFKAIKFRSMIKNSGVELTREDDLRITKIGFFLRKTAMDELPQMLNILKGEMSFVGPRATPAHIAEEIVKKMPSYKLRYSVKPGLTGIAQVFGSYDSSPQEKLRYDLWYIKNYNFFLDIYLIFLSFLVTFVGKWETRREKFKFLKKFKERIEREIGEG